MYTVVIKLYNGTSFDVVLHDIHFHPVIDCVLHIDFYQLFADKAVAMDIPVHVIGTSPGVKWW